MTKRLVAFIVLLGVAGCAAPETPRGAALAAEKGCVACHGVDGQGVAPTFPNLSGQWEQYLRLQLFAYRAGTRENAIMNGQAAGLSDVEIRALAAHYAGN